MIEDSSHKKNGDIQLNFYSGDLIGKDYEYAVSVMEDAGFTKIQVKEGDSSFPRLFKGNGKHTVQSISINGKEGFAMDSWHDPNSTILIIYNP